MKKRLSRLLACGLAAVIAFTTVLPETAYAVAMPEQTEVSVEATTEDGASEEIAEEINLDESVEDVSVSDNSDEVIEEVTDETTDDEEIEETDKEEFGELNKLNYLYLDSQYVEGPGTQYAVVSFGDENTVITKGALTIRNYENKDVTVVESEEAMDNTIMFAQDYSADDNAIYEITDVAVTLENGKEFKVNLASTGMDRVYYGVNTEITETDETGKPVEETNLELETQIVTFEDGVEATTNAEIEHAIEDAIGEAEAHTDEGKIGLNSSIAGSIGSLSTIGLQGEKELAMTNGNLIVVLDPGHDATHAGARANGLNEEDLTLKIAQYCKKELETYRGVKVYMTRNSAACPNPGTSSTDDNGRRVDYAKSVGADVYVSIHLNSAAASAAGAQVYYPNASYNASIGSKGANLSTQILRQLTALGLANGGIRIRNSEDGTRYPDGSLADYYGVIRRSKLSGFPGIIIEHAFLTNPSDAAFLKNEANLKKLGIADATGIAKYYDLSNVKITVNDIKFKDVAVTSSDNATGKFTVQASGVSPVDGVQKLELVVWSKTGGQDDVKSYSAKGDGKGNYTYTISASNHKLDAGTYYIDAYVYDFYGGKKKLKSITNKLTKVEPTVTDYSQRVTTSGKLKLSLKGENLSAVSFYVWNEADGESSRIKYKATDNGKGTWSYSVPLSDFKKYGTYHVQRVCKNVWTTMQSVETTIEVTPTTVGSVDIPEDEISSEKGKFKVYIGGIDAMVGVSSITAKIWRKEDKSDLYSYTASELADGRYLITGNIKYHGYKYGTYNVEITLKDNIGKKVKQTEMVTISRPIYELEAIDKYDNQTAFKIKASNVVYAGGVTAVKYKVWSEVDGKDDVKTYTAKLASDGTWNATVKPVDHGAAGKYNVQMYVYDKLNKSHTVETTEFNVTGPELQDEENDFAFGLVDNENGTCSVSVNNIDSVSGVKTVKFEVWSKTDKSNLYKYTAKKQENGSYATTIKLKKHKFYYGDYNVRVHITDNNGITNIYAKTVTFTMPTPSISYELNEKETKCVLNASDVIYAGGVSRVRFYVWSTENGKDDAVWYDAKKNISGDWSASIKPSKHKNAGEYQALMYIYDSLGTKHKTETITFDVVIPEITGLVVADDTKDAVAGSFIVSALPAGEEQNGYVAPSGVKEITYQVWNNADKKGTKYTYTAKFDSETNAYSAKVKIKNHKYMYGTFTVKASITDKNGFKTSYTVDDIAFDMPLPIIAINDMNHDQTIFRVTATDAVYAGGITNVKFKAYSRINGEDDKITYTAKVDANGVYYADIKPAKHGFGGDYDVVMYIYDKNGAKHEAGKISFFIDGPTIDTVFIDNVNHEKGTFSVTTSGVSAENSGGVKKVTAKVYSKEDKSNSYTYNTVYDSEADVYKFDVKIKNHKYKYGTYTVEVYATDQHDIKTVKVEKVTLVAPVTSTSALVNEKDTSAIMIVENAIYAGTPAKVQFAVWSENGGKDDIVWYDAVHTEDNTWKATCKISNHKTVGTYQVVSYLFDKSGAKHKSSSTTFKVTTPKISSIAIANKNEKGGIFSVKVAGATSRSGISKVQYAVWCAKNKSDLIWYTASLAADGTYSSTVDVRNHKMNTGTYTIDAYITGKNGVKVKVGSTTCKMVNVDFSLYPIMGSSSVTVDQMMRYYNSVTTYPAFYAKSDAPTLKVFCQMYLDECKAEGVRAEVAFAQAMKETNFLRYTGDVRINQYNFAGLGATGGGVVGNTYPTVRYGIRAQVQHLKAYASTEPLKQGCVDDRFQYVSRGCAPYVEWLGQKENPTGKGWATAVNYGPDIVFRVNKIKTY